MQSQAVNNHARRRYSEFESAIGTVRLALDELAATAKKGTDKSDKRFHGWQVPTRKEVEAQIKRASAELDNLRVQANKYKSELISRGWRV